MKSEEGGRRAARGLLFVFRPSFYLVLCLALALAPTLTPATALARPNPVALERSMRLIRLAAAGPATPTVPHLRPGSETEIRAGVMRALAQNSRRVAGEMSKTYLIVLMVIGVTAAREMIRAASSDGALSPGEVAQATARAAGDIVNSSALPAAVLAFMASTGLIDAAARASLTEMYRSAAFRAAFGRFMVAGIGFGVGSVAATMISSLVDEAAWQTAQRTGVRDDFERARKLSTLFAAGSDPLAGEMIWSLVNVLTTADGLRAWLSNGWRLNATGEFAATLAALGAGVGAGAAAGLAYAAVGGVVGVAFVEALAIAVVFVGVYAIIPEETKARITRGAQGARGWANGAQLSRTTLDLRSALSRPMPLWAPNARAEQIGALLLERGGARDRQATIAFEKVRNAIQAWTDAHRSPESAAAASSRISEAHDALMPDLNLDVSSLSELADLARRTRPELAPMFERELRRASALREFLDDALAGSAGIPQMTAERIAEPDLRQFLDFVELSYRRGFDSQPILNAALLQAAAPSVN